MQTLKGQFDAAVNSVNIKSTLVHHEHHRQGTALYVSEVLSDRAVEDFQDIMLIDSRDENDNEKGIETNDREETKTAWIDLMTLLPSDIVRSVRASNRAT